MIALFYNYADPDGNPSRDFRGVFDDVENIPMEYRREWWSDYDNRHDCCNDSRIIEPQIKSYGGKRFYLPSEEMNFGLNEFLTDSLIEIYDKLSEI